jgi:molybdopterin-guanine dinucleotide biosynthesis protein B
VDLVVAEGFKAEPVPRVEVHRREVSRAFLCARDPRVFAIVTDEPPPRPVRAFREGEIEALADLVCVRLRLRGKPLGLRRLRGRPAVSSVRAEGSGRTVAHGRRERMAKTTTRKSGSRRSATKSRTSRSGAASKGGKATLRTRGAEFYSEIGRKGAKSRRTKAARGAAGRSTGRGSRRSGGRTRSGSRAKSR